MNERTARYIAYGFAAVSALGVPATSLANMAPLNATLFAGATLVMIYFAENPRLLVASRQEYDESVRRGLAIPLVLVLGALLIIIGVVEAIVRSRAT
jgi:hypothetical protein